MHISITGLKINSFLHYPVFYYHATRCLKQAKAAQGNLYAGVNIINGIHHTLSAWQSTDAMKMYAFSGAHKQAIQVFRRIATGKILSYQADTIPAWDEVHHLWIEQGNEY